jgi:predicted NUDIX family phosphoesterase
VNENVLVVPATKIAPFLTGVFSSANLQNALEFILGNHSFRSRALVENDPGFKQIIPYVLIAHKEQYLLTQRTNRQTESRLHGKHSIGIGGHINDLEKPGATEDVIQAGLERELNEELELRGKRVSLNLAGIISDDSTPVGSVHLGLVFVLHTDSPEFAVRETELMTAQWAPVEMLREKLALMESWSQIAFENVIESNRSRAATEVIVQ